MIQANEPQGPHYAVQLARGVPQEARLPRAEQSAAAADLLSALRVHASIPAGWSSKAHARAISAVALSGVGCVGIDVEFEAPGRDICAIASSLMQATPADDAAAYRVFTLYEAYFKATDGGSAPLDVLCLAAAATTARYRMPGDWHVLHEAPAEGFILTLVWRGGGAPVRYHLPEQPEGRL